MTTIIEEKLSSPRIIQDVQALSIPKNYVKVWSSGVGCIAKEESEKIV